MNKVDEQVTDKQIEWLTRHLLQKSISSDYVDDILADEDENGTETILQAIIADVKETSGYEDEGVWNEDDVRLAIGRVLMSRLNIYQ